MACDAGTNVSETLTEALVRLAGFVRAWARPSALVGGAAIIARAQPRMTTDLDLLIVVPTDGVDPLLALAGDHGYAYEPDEVRMLIEGGLVRLWGPPGPHQGVGVDLMFVDSPFLERVVERATAMQLGDAQLPVASAEDLLLMKMEAGRPHDLDDALAIKDAFAASLDRAYLQRWAKQLGVERQLEVLLGP
jgi:hypothetical protein